MSSDLYTSCYQSPEVRGVPDTQCRKKENLDTMNSLNPLSMMAYWFKVIVLPCKMFPA